MVFLKIAISILGLGGFYLARYIHTHKKVAGALVCPLEGSCESVVHSDYSKFLGIPVEYLGMFYYGLTAALYALSIFFEAILPPEVSYFMVGITVIAFVFSIYLTAVQAFVLKEWCTWCLCSAGICTAIFICAIYLTDTGILDFIPNFLL